MAYVIRYVESLLELVEAFDLMGAQFTKPLTHEDRQFCDLARRFPQDRSMMLVVEYEGRIIGGALAFRGGSEPGPDSDVTLRIIALVPDHRSQGLGRRLVRRIEHEATNLGARGISLGADEAIGFYHRLGYRGSPGCVRSCRCRRPTANHTTAAACSKNSANVAKHDSATNPRHTF